MRKRSNAHHNMNRVNTESPTYHYHLLPDQNESLDDYYAPDAQDAHSTLHFQCTAYSLGNLN